MAIINKYIIETLEQSDEGICYVEKTTVVKFFGIRLFRKILNTTNQKEISLFNPEKQYQQIGFNNLKCKEKANENKN